MVKKKVVEIRQQEALVVRREAVIHLLVALVERREVEILQQVALAGTMVEEIRRQVASHQKVEVIHQMEV